MTIQELEKAIVENSQRYYDGEATIPDYEFDRLIDELSIADPFNNILNSIGWGYDITKSSGNKAKHKYQLIGSLEKVKSSEMISGEISNSEKVVVSAKLDGLSCVAYYLKGRLVRAITRGNGTVGIDITDKLLMLIGKKLKKGSMGYSLHDFSGAIRGELVVSNENWEKVKAKYPEAKNPRNFASGVINRNEITSDLEFVEFVVYNIVGYDNYQELMEFQSSILLSLSSCFKKVVPYTTITKHNKRKLDDVSLKEYFKLLSNDYPCDGLVLTKDDCNVEEGIVSYAQQAYKFDAETKETYVTGIDWKLSRTSRLIPTVLVSPVELSGATVSRASGFNAKYILDNRIGEGSVIELQRSGEVIPDIKTIISEANDFYLPKKCPVCNEVLDWSGVDLVCNNMNCGNIDYRDLQSWVGIIATVDGLGSTLKFNFLDENGINSVEEFYQAYEGFELIEDAAYSSTEKKYLVMMKKLLKDPIDSVDALTALNIPRLGRSSAEKLSAVPGLVKDLIDNGINEMNVEKVIKAVGPATLDSITSNMIKFKRLNLIKDRIAVKESKSKEGVKIAVTGALSMKRDEFERIANSNGYILSGNIKECKYLVTNTPFSGSSKNSLADKYKVEKITEEQFMKIIGE